MKKLFNLILVLGLCFNLAGCGGSEVPEGMADKVYEAGCKALDVIDEYLDGKLEAKDANKQMVSLNKQILSEGDDHNTNMMKMSIESASFNATKAGGSGDAKVKEERDSIAKYLGK